MLASPAGPRGGRPPSAAESPRAASRGPTAKLAAHFGEFRDFLHRGTPQTPTRSRGSSRSGGPPSAVLSLRQLFAAWTAAGEVQPDQVRLVGAQLLQQQLQQQQQGKEPSADDVPDSSSPSSSLLEAAFVFDGVEVFVKVSVAAGAAAPAAGTGGDAASGAGGSSVSIIALGAETRCRWPLAERRVAMVAEAVVGQPLEELLDCLLDAFRDGLDDDQVGDSFEEGATSPTRSRISCEGSGDFEDEGASRSGASTPASVRPTDFDMGLARSFARWLDDRPPLLRFQNAARGMAWDYPPSKTEKHELLLLQLFAQEEQRHAEMQAVRGRSSIAPSAATGTACGEGRRGSCGSEQRSRSSGAASSCCGASAIA